MRATPPQKVALGFLVTAPGVVSVLVIGFRHIDALAAFGIIFNLLVCAFLFVLILRRIAQRDRAENTLRESEERFKQLVQHVGDIIYRTDCGGHFIFINQTVEPLMGYEPDELLGHHFLDLVAPAARAEVEEFYRRQFAEQTANTFHYFPVQRKDGSEMWVAQTVQLLFEDGRLAGAQGVARDATQRVRLQEELARARDAAIESARLKSEFVANTSHEIRTPMHSIIGMTNLLADTALDRDQGHFVDNIRQSAEELLHLINDILDFSKIESGKLQIEAVDFDVRAAIDGVINIFVEAAQAKNLKLSSHIDTDVRRVIHADPLRLRQILTNLVGNALKFTPEGEVVLTLKCISQTETDTGLRFEISDTGIGISDEAQRRLFSAFVQADGSTARRFGGTGLGLAISKQLVEAMGGEIGVNSQPRKGSTFWFTLKAAKPIGTTAALPVQEAIFPPAVVKPNHLPNRDGGRESRRFRRGSRLLVVEDNPINREVARYQIEKIGYRVDLAQDSAEALAMLDRQDYAVILMDCHLPGMDGFEAAARIRHRKDKKGEVPIIAVTASASAGERERCLQAGMNDFLLKPFRAEELSRKIDYWIGDALPEPAGGDHDTATLITTDVSSGLKQLEADYGSEMVIKIIAIFIPDAEARMERIDQAIKQKDFKALEEAAHGLKSGAANIGAMEMAQLAEQLERQGELASIDGAEEVLKKLTESWTEVRMLNARYN
jgi:PAS domain S-box-containing protein